jgi:predicted lipoprotein with Yx(FWY)xxD motif
VFVALKPGPEADFSQLAEQRSPVHRTKRVVGGRAVRVGLVTCLVAAGAITTALAATKTVIRTTNSLKYGRILEGPARYTLYVFCPGVSSHCTGTSSRSWPPLIAHGRVVAASHSGLKPRKLSTRKISGGRRQVTYYGQPLYLYKGDHKPRQTNGEQRATSKGSWFVINISGRAVPKGGY